MNANFAVDSFAFLRESIPTKAEVGLSLLSAKVTLTCFDVNERLLVFGSDCGILYGFRRGEKATKRAHFRMAAVSTSIANVKLIDYELLAFTTNDQLIVYTLNNLQILYVWKNERSDGQHAFITTFTAFMDTNSSLMLLSGDQLGVVHKHQVSQSKSELLFEENESEDSKHKHHRVVQIEICDQETILVSTCLRSLLIKVSPDATEVIQIGKNTRKVCGNYGAIFCGDYLYAARPSLHLIKANKVNANVIETFILKKAKDPPPLLSVSRVHRIKPIQLGSLIVLPTRSPGFISWNAHSFLVIDADGHLLIKESNLMDLMDVKTSISGCFADVFLLFKDRTFLRLRQNIENMFDANPMTQSHHQSDDLLDVKQTGDIPVGPNCDNKSSFSIQPFEQIGELKRIFLKFQNKITGDGYKDVSCDASSTETTSNSDLSENESRKSSVTEDNDVLNEPLVVHKKFRRVKHKLRKLKEETQPNLPLHDEEECEKMSTTDCVDDEHDERTQKSFDDSDDVEERLSNILKAFRMDSKCNALVEADDLIMAEESETRSSVESEATLSLDKQEHDDSLKSESRMEAGALDIRWCLVLEGSCSMEKRKILSLCASSYDDEIGVGYVWLSCRIDKQVELYYLPSFKTIRRPANKSKIVHIGVNTKQLLLLYEDGSLYRRTGDSTKPLADKWIQINVNRPQCKLGTISVNNSNGVVWCCDHEGNVWLLKSSSNKTQLVPVRDDNELTISFKAVVVAPQDSSIVWALSRDNYVFMRNGVFNENGKDDELIAGISWFKVEIAIVPKCIAVTSHSVWVLNEDGNRLFRRVGIEPPFDLLGHSWQEVKCPTLVNDCVKQLSASLNDDIWLLTHTGSVWKHCQHPITSLHEVECDWILVK